MKTTTINLFIAITISCSLFTACSKSGAVNDLNQSPGSRAQLTTENQAPLKAGLLNQNLEIIYATDGATDVTHQFKSYVFNFSGQQPAGEALVWNGQVTQTGSWSWREFTDVFVMDFHEVAFPYVQFLSRAWRIDNIEDPNATTIRLVANDGDVIHLAAYKGR